MARTLAALLGSLCLLNLVVSLGSGAFNANLWWIDLRALPALAAIAIESAAAVACCGSPVEDPCGRGRAS